VGHGTTPQHIPQRLIRVFVCLVGDRCSIADKQILVAGQYDRGFQVQSCQRMPGAYMKMRLGKHGCKETSLVMRRHLLRSD
jgi:hypothetical protein